MGYKIPLHELEKAKKVKKVTDKMLTVLATLGKITLGLVVLACLASIIYMVWQVSIAGGILVLVLFVSGGLAVGAMMLNDSARNTIRDAKDYGVIDE